MQLRWTLAAVTLAAAAAAGPAQANDPVANLVTQVEDTAYHALVSADNAVDGLDRVVVVGPAPTPRQARVLGSADKITIKNMGSGITVTYGGVLNTLWDCSETMNIGASVVATCTPKANSNIDWTCGVMGVTAVAHSRVIDFYDHAVEILRTPPVSRHADAGPNVPDPRPRRWGQVAGLVACDSHQAETAQAGRDNPVASTSATMGAVTAFTCEARRSPGVASAPIPDYTVECVDPANPTTLG